MQSHLTTQELVSALATFVNRDDAGRHFTEVHPDALLAELERLELIAIDRPVHEETGISWSQEYWTAEVTPAGVELVEAYPEYHPDAIRAAVVEQAKQDAAAFVAEFDGPLNPATTDWDATAWGEVRIGGAADMWEAYQAALVAETERLCDQKEQAPRPTGFYANDVEVFFVTPSGRVWIVASPDVETVKEIDPADLPTDVIAANELVGSDSTGYCEQITAESGEVLG